MLIAYFLLDFWYSNKYWVEPQTFDTLFGIVFGLYLLITFLPDVVGYFALKGPQNFRKVRQITDSILRNTMDSLAITKEDRKQNESYFKYYDSYMMGVDIEMAQIEQIILNQTNKYVNINILILLFSLVYLGLSSNYNSSHEVHRVLITIVLVVFIIPFISSVITTRNKIKPHSKTLDKINNNLQRISKAHQDGDVKKILEIVLEGI